MSLTFLRQVSNHETIVMLLPLSPAGALPAELTRVSNMDYYKWAPDGKSLIADTQLPGNSPRGLRLFSVTTRT